MEKLNENEIKLQREKEEIEELFKQQLEETRKNREAVVSVLEIAQKHAKDIMENAQKNAHEIEKEARDHAEKEKSNLDREIEIRKRDMNNQFLSESKKINALRKEIEEMRRHSLESIRKFENELSNIDRHLEQKENYANKAVNSVAENDGFLDFIKKVPIRIIKTENKEEN